ncbi:hypothetical protein V8Z81_31970 (plasmid) [Priestia megaterium]
MNREPNKPINTDSLFQDLDEKVEQAKADCDKTIKAAEEFLKRRQSPNS